MKGLKYIILPLLVLGLCACSKENSETQLTETTAENAASVYDLAPADGISALSYSDIVLPEISSEITEEELDAAIASFLSENGVEELTDEFAQGLEGYGFKSAEEFRSFYAFYLQTLRRSASLQEQKNVLWEALRQGAEYTEAAEEAVESFCAEKEQECIARAEANGMSLTDFAAGQDYESADTLLAAVRQSADEQARTILIMRYISEQEGISYTEDEYYDAVSEYAQYLGYGSNAELITGIGLDAVERIVSDSLLYNMVTAFMLEKVGAEQ